MSRGPIDTPRIHTTWDGLDGWGDNTLRTATCSCCTGPMLRPLPIWWFVDAQGYAVIADSRDCLTELLMKHGYGEDAA